MIRPDYIYRIRSVESVYDGDTCTVVVELHPQRLTERDGVEYFDFGFSIYDVFAGSAAPKLKEIGIRVYGIDTPEMRGGTAESKARAVLARDRLKELLASDGCYVKTHRDEADKYGGRWLGELWLGLPGEAESVNIADLLIGEGHGVPYFGGKK